MSYNSKYKSSKIEEILDSVGGKQAVIADLEEIRQGAAKGKEAYDLAESKASMDDVNTAIATAITTTLNTKV